MEWYGTGRNVINPYRRAHAARRHVTNTKWIVVLIAISGSERRSHAGDRRLIATSAHTGRRQGAQHQINKFCLHLSKNPKSALTLLADGANHHNIFLVTAS